MYIHIKRCRFCHHDRRIPIPGFAEYGKGDHSALATPAMVEVSIPSGVSAPAA